MTLPQAAFPRTGDPSIDRVIQHIESYLNGGLVPGAETIGSFATGLYFQAFDTSPAWRYEAGSVANVSFVSDGKTGGRALRVTGHAHLVDATLIPFTAARFYRMRARVRLAQAPTDPAKGLLSIGFEGVAGDRATKVNRLGVDDAADQHYMIAAALDMTQQPVGDWIDLVGYFQGVSDPAGGFPR